MAKYIHKQAAIHALVNEANIHKNPIKRAYTRAAAIIEQITAEDVQSVKQGYWKDIMMSEATGWDLSLTGGRDEVLETVCSVCGDCCAFDGDGEPYLSSYCPNCGAYMGELTE